MDLLDIAIAKQLAGGGGGSGTDNYNDLSNLPKINDVTLSGNKSSSALGLQSEITSENKLDSDLIDDTNQDNKFVTSSEKNTWNAKQNAIDADHKLNADYVDDSTSTNKFVTASDKEAWNAKQSAIDSDHKLSSSLVSFSAAEAAALASGIDNAKVAQISTNQTNILSVQKATEELVDKGAKNRFNFDAWKSVGVYRGSKTVNGNSVTITSSQNDAFTYVDIANGYPQDAIIYVSTGDKLIFTWDYTNSNSQATDEVMIYGNGAYTSYVHVLASAKYLEYTVPSGITYITIRLGVATSGDSATYSNMMICTEADWKISQKYAPYRKNLDQLEATKAPALSTITMDSGSLDDITTNSFIACSWEVAGKPISTMGFVRTSVFDANSALQEFYSFSADETQSRLVYVRDKQAGVWRSWKLLTNNT